MADNGDAMEVGSYSLRMDALTTWAEIPVTAVPTQYFALARKSIDFQLFYRLIRR